MTARRTITLHGTTVSGVREATGLTELPWVKKQFVDKFGIDSYPGTFNIKILPEDEEKLNIIKSAAGTEITPPDANFCAGKAFLVTAGSRVRGAAIIPLVPTYPRLQFEIISSVNIRQTLGLADGDPVEVEVYLTEADQVRPGM